ncbi:hypothetical protein [Streptomyces albidoflavus]|uniref:hypothetical protein n=1 Tax=Streptomyces albidoflavus TaxID=1886 RepID=UPI0033EBE516
MTTPPSSPREALAHVLAVFADEPASDMAVVATRNQPTRGAVTGLTWGDLRALAVSPPQVWLLMRGVDDDIDPKVRAFATREAGRAALTRAARDVHADIARAEKDADGTLRLYGPLGARGVAWLELSPHAVTTETGMGQ